MPAKRKEGGWVCEYCHKTLPTKRALYYGHYAECPAHQEIVKTLSNGKTRTKPRAMRRCRFCGIEKLTTKEGANRHEKCCSKNPNRIYPKGHPVDTNARKKISNAMKKAHAEGRAWNIGKSRWKGTPSYPESFFMRVIQNEFPDKDYTYEYPVNDGIRHYSIDFAWINKKKYIELDGEQHQRFHEYQERDQRKDKFLQENGWVGLRIAWKDMFNNPQEWINRAKEFIGV